MSLKNIDPACEEIRQICRASHKVSQFFDYGGHSYKGSVRHYLDSSSEVAYAAVEPGSVEDLEKIMQVIAKYRVPFAVKGGGHAINPRFSSTEGIQISMTRFNDIQYDPQTKRLEVESGCLFDEVYKNKAMRDDQRNIVGGSAVAGVGVGGYYLGGGYSLKTNQYGLGIDNIHEIHLTLPNGKASVKLSDDSDPELFKAVKGGGNNFGIVTKLILDTHPQGSVYGGILVYREDVVGDVKRAILEFIRGNENEPRAAIEASFRHYQNNKFKFTVQCYFDGEKPSPDPFAGLLDIPYEAWPGYPLGLTTQSYRKMDQMLSTIENMAFGSLEGAKSSTAPKIMEEASMLQANVVDSQPGPEKNPPMAGIGEANARGRWGTVMISHYTQKLIDAIEQEGKSAGADIMSRGGKMIVTDIWPFVPTMFRKSKEAAWPHKDGQPNSPSLIYFFWEGEENDKFWKYKLREVVKRIHKVAVEEGCTSSDAPVYLNTTLDDTTVEEIYRGNLSHLSAIRKKVDPDDVMSLTGGFRIPLPTS